MDEEQRPAAHAVATGQLTKLPQYKGVGGQQLVEPRQSALQRIQVGLIGLVVVLLFVSLANMVLDRVTDTATNDPLASMGAGSADKEAIPDEPLAELGVTPVASDEEAPKSVAPVPTQNMQQVPAPARR